MAEIIAEAADDTVEASAIAWPDATGKAIADALGVSAPWLRTLEKQGFVERKANGLFDAGAVCLGYIRWLKDDARRASKAEGAKAIDAEKLRKLKIDNAKALGQLVDFDLVECFFAESMTELRNSFGGIPDGVTRDSELHKKITDWLNRGYERYRAAFEKMAAADPPGSADAELQDDDL